VIFTLCIKNHKSIRYLYGFITKVVMGVITLPPLKKAKKGQQLHVILKRTSVILKRTSVILTRTRLISTRRV
jgi:hypothetical protein